jgi:hypothetical protein
VKQFSGLPAGVNKRSVSISHFGQNQIWPTISSSDQFSCPVDQLYSGGISESRILVHPSHCLIEHRAPAFPAGFLRKSSL